MRERVELVVPVGDGQSQARVARRHAFEHVQQLGDAAAGEFHPRLPGVGLIGDQPATSRLAFRRRTAASECPVVRRAGRRCPTSGRTGWLRRAGPALRTGPRASDLSSDGGRRRRAAAPVRMSMSSGRRAPRVSATAIARFSSASASDCSAPSLTRTTTRPWGSRSIRAVALVGTGRILRRETGELENWGTGDLPSTLALRHGR